MEKNRSPASPKIAFYRSLLWRFSSLFVLVISLSGLLQLYFSTLGWRQLVEEIEQQVNWDLASDVAQKIQPALLSTPYNQTAVQELLFHLSAANPKIEFILLTADGHVIASVPYRDNLARLKIDLAPIHASLAPEAPPLPLYGDDPFRDYDKKIFSVAPIRIADQSGYLYIPLMSTSYRFLILNSGRFYLFRNIMLGVLIASIFALAIGLFLFSFLSRRFSSLVETIERLGSGELTQRIAVKQEDEIGRIGHAFNTMAETISENTRQLEEKDRIRRELVSNIAHDLRGPVTSMIAHIQFIQEHPLAEEQVREYLTIILENAQSQGNLIEDLFDLAALEAKGQKVDRDYCSIEKIVRAVVDELSSTAARKNVSLSLQSEQTLPLVFVDSRLIRRVFTNLVSNAIRYTLNEGAIQIRVRNTSAGVLVSVTDSGIGIPQEELPYVFDEFYRANRHRPEDPGGTGLGLAIVKKILQLHHATFSIQSEVNVGTTVEFTLPPEEQ